MSTPSGKLGNHIDLSAYEPRRARERAAAEQHPSEDKTDPLRSPYAPKRGHDPAGTERHPVENRHQPPAAERRDEITSDRDLVRLEASLRWLQRQEAVTRLPRATPLPPVSGLAPVDATDRHHNSEMLVDSLQAPRSLEPERLAPPIEMTSRRPNLRWPLGILVASILAAPIAYYFSVGGWGPPPELGPQIASLDQMIVSSHLKATQESRPTRAQDQDAETSVPAEMSSERTGISQTARSSESETVAMLQGGITGAQAPSPGKANRTLDPEEVKFLRKQGEQFAAAGDLVTARILLQRAAEAGDAAAAMALGATYDPNVLAKLGVVGMNGDVEKARSWYRKAESFGSPDSSQRLNALANR
jgi:hypothetical protein